MDVEIGSWWEYGNYDGTSCKNCGRERVMVCDAPDMTDHRVCEKCCWDQEYDEYASLLIMPNPLY